MKLLPLVLLQCLVALAAAFAVPAKDYAQRQYFVVEIDHSRLGKPLHDFITKHQDYRFEHPVRGLDDHFVFSVEQNHDHLAMLGNFNLDPHNLIKRAPGLEGAYDSLTLHPGLKLVHMLHPKRLERRMPVPIEVDSDQMDPRGVDIVDSLQEGLKEVSDKLDINDPLFVRQWHLVNTRYPGNDVNVKNLWLKGITGHNVTVAVIDDGLDHDLEDLKANFNAEGSWDFNDNTNLPTPRLFDDYHGTRCAGEIAAVKNDVCGIGVAYEGKVAGIRILSGAISSEEEAAAMIYGLEHNDIYSCSWGPRDNGKTVAAPDMLVRKAMIKGIQDGRQGKGAVYVFASGNGRQYDDQCNFDGYTNSIYSITVGAIDHQNQWPFYAEACSAVMVVTYSAGSGEHIHTTDIKKKCSNTHGGTSAAAPLAAGIYALVLEANPNLTWRDVQHVSARAAVTVNEHDGEYQETALGLKYSHKYGYGKIDAEKLVEEAKKWKNVKPQAWYYSDKVQVDKSVKSGPLESSEVISSSLNVTKEDLELVNLEKVEHVTVTVSIDSTVRGQIQVNLISPHGVVSKLAQRRALDMSSKGLQNWTFLSVAHFGEDGVGEWKLEVSSSRGENDIRLKDWLIRLFGESIDADKAVKYDITRDYAAERRELQKNKSKSTSSTETVTSTTSLTTSSSTTRVEATATSQEATTSSTETTKTNEKEAEKTEKPEKPDSSDDSSDEDSDKEDDKPEDGKQDNNKHYAADHAGQYFMALAVIGFIIAIITMKCHKSPGSTRRRRRDDYEFDIIPGEDYSDSEEDERDSLDLGTQREREQETLFDDFNAETLPDYEDEMFQIGDEGDAHEDDRDSRDTSKPKANEESLSAETPESYHEGSERGSQEGLVDGEEGR